MNKLLILIAVGIVQTLSSQTLFKNNYVNAQTIINSSVFESEETSIPTDSLLIYYDFNNQVNDQSGNGNDATNNGVTFTDNAGIFGTSKYLSLPDITSGLTSLTYCFWINVSQDFTETYQSPFSVNSSVLYTGMYFNNTQIKARLSTVSTFFDINILEDDIAEDSTWVFMAFTWDGDTGKLYKDNVFIGFDTSGDDTIESRSGGTMGYTASTYLPSNTLIDDFRLYSDAKTEDELTILYDEGGYSP